MTFRRTCRSLILLDRDGVLGERPAPHAYVRRAEDFRWLPGALEAAGQLSGLGAPIVVVSNQRGVARNLITRQDLRAIQHRMQADARADGWQFARFYYCFHDLSEACDCRKPEPGMLLRAAKELGGDLAASVMIGDAETDVEAGRRVGCATIRIASQSEPTAADLTAPSLATAVRLLVDRWSVPADDRAV